MRKNSLLALTLASMLALPAAGAQARADLPDPSEPPSSCKYLANTICQYLPPDSVGDVCAILDTTTGGGLSCVAPASA